MNREQDKCRNCFDKNKGKKLILEKNYKTCFDK